MKISVYVPTRGNPNCELIQRLNDLGLSYSFAKGGVSIAHLRNSIVKEFLEEKADVLLMIDDDVIPPPNLLKIFEPLEEGKAEIVSAIVPVIRPGQIIAPNVYKKTGDNYDPDWENALNPDGGLRFVDAAGTGCMAISRKVFEKVKHPFKEELHPDGRIKIGEDLIFCKRAQSQGFKILAHFDVTCEHYHPVHLNEVQLSYMQLFEGALTATEDEDESGKSKTPEQDQ